VKPLRRLARIVQLVVSPYRELRRPVCDIDTDLERRQEIARRTAVVQRRNVDRALLIEDQPDYGESGLVMRRPIG